MYKAYLCVFIQHSYKNNLKNGPSYKKLNHPKITKVGIFSSDPDGLTTDFSEGCWAALLFRQSETYDIAKQCVLEYLDTQFGKDVYGWVKPLLIK